MKNIATALLKVQQSLDPIHKGKKGYGYTYADLPAVLNAVVDVLNQNGVVVVQSPDKTEKNAACIVTRLIHADSGEEITSVIEVPFDADNKQKMSVAQAYGSAITYAKRYALVSMLGVATEDDDGASAGTKDKPQAPQPPKTLKQTAVQSGPSQADKQARVRGEEHMSRIRTQLAALDSYQQAEWAKDEKNTKDIEIVRWLKSNMPDLYEEIKGTGFEV